MKRVVALIMACLLLFQVASAETVKVAKTNFYQSDKRFEVTGDVTVKRMAFGQASLGTLSVDAIVLDETEFEDTQALIVKKDTSVTFSYTDIKTMDDNSIPDTSWHIASDGARSIGTIDFKSKIEKGGIVVQKSLDGSEWSTAFTNTNIFANSPEELRNFYTASRADIGNGCYYRITIAYKTERKTKQSNFLFIDTSSWDHRWHVEMYEIFLLSDDEAPENINVAITSQNYEGIGAGTMAFPNQSAINSTASVDTFNWGDGGTGMAAEGANVLSHTQNGLLNGTTVEHTGSNNVKNGPDYIITSADGTITQVQCKYYKTAGETIRACFEDGVFRYYSDTNVPMTIEVPADQYDRAVLLMKNRIANGQVPGVTDPEQASEIVRKGSVTYQQAVKLAKAGTIESLTYDAKTGCVTALSAFGISAVVQYAVSRWNGESVDVALKNSLYTGLRIGGNAFVTTILSSQLTRTGLNSLLVPGSEAVIRLIGPKAAAVIVNAGRVGLKPIYGAAAMKSAARMLRGGVIVNTVSFLVFTIPDTVELFRGRISGKQMIKNASSTIGGLAGAALGASGGAALGTAIFPGVGTTVGGIVGGVAGGIGVSIGVDVIADLIAEDDADEMLDIIQMEFQNLAEEYLLNIDEAEHVSAELQSKLDLGKLKEMFASDNHHSYARDIIEPVIKTEVSKRTRIVLPDDKTITEGLVNTLEEIYDDMGMGTDSNM